MLKDYVVDSGLCWKISNTSHIVKQIQGVWKAIFMP